jgi:rare lipoprotein A
MSLAAAATAALTVAVGGCVGTRHEELRPATPAAPAPAAALPSTQPPETVPDAVPRYEPRSIYGNPPFYDVFGKRYFVLSSSADYVERGVASWYGPGFHKVRTSTQEPYDMYGMSAAHKTLPLPCYARVTNLQNGRSVVVRVNDRGPFVGNRIIDLSYTAAAKLDMLRNGTAMVEVRTVGPASVPGGVPSPPSAAPPSVTPATVTPATVTPATVTPATVTPATVTASSVTPPGAAPPSAGPPAAPVIAPAPVTSAPVAALFVQAGAFADPANAQRLAQRLRDGGYGKVFVRDDVIAGRRMYRVRIGPVPDVPDFDRIVAALEQVGVRDAHLALD